MQLAKAFEGWQAGIVAVVVAWVGALLVVPRSADPAELPRLALDATDVRAARTRLAAARSGMSPTLQNQLFEARFRSFGKEEFDAPEGASPEATARLREIGVEMRKHGADELVLVRDALAAEFVASAQDWLRGGPASDTLRELGGPFERQMAANGWTPQNLHAEPAIDLAVWAMFDLRFQKLVGPKDARLDPHATAKRALYALFLSQPPTVASELGPVVEHDASTQQAALIVRKLDELSGFAPEYPTLFAKGVVYHRMGRVEAAAAMFDRYLEENPRGPYRLRAVNHMRAAVFSSDSR